MNDISKDIMQLGSQGYCCSQIMVELALEATEDENPQLVDAVRGLCKGLYTGMLCGTLTGAACLLSMLDVKAAEEHLIPRLTEWFEMTFTECYGGTSCKIIMNDNPMNKFERCPKIMAQTYEKCRELLSEAGHQI
jgi:hypothetical protein